MTHHSQVCVFQQKDFMLHTRVGYLHGSLKEKLKNLTLGEENDSFMLQLLQGAFDNHDKRRAADVHVFILFNPVNLAEGPRMPVAWATVYHATWARDFLDTRVNEASVFVDPEHRGKGYSFRLLSWAREQRKRSKRLWLGCPSDVAGRAAFSKLGIEDGNLGTWIPVSILEA